MYINYHQHAAHIPCLCCNAVCTKLTDGTAIWRSTRYWFTTDQMATVGSYAIVVVGRLVEQAEQLSRNMSPVTSILTMFLLLRLHAWFTHDKQQCQIKERH